MDSYLLQCDTLILLIAVALGVITATGLSAVDRNRNKENMAFLHYF